MKIGILLCGDVPPELLSEFGNYTDCLISKLSLERSDEINVWDVYQQHQLPEDVFECDAYIIGGSPSGVNDGLEWVKSLIQFVRKAFITKRKLFGICFGHQVIHHALGGEVRRAEQGWGLGAYPVQLERELGDLKSGQTMSLIAIHQDQVIKLGKNFEVLAGSKFCPNYITCFKNQVLTVQGHPEFSRLFFNALLMLRTDQFSKEVIEKSIVRGEDTVEYSAIFNRFVHQFLFH